MAKTKKKDIIDLKPEKINSEQLERVQKTVNSINRAQLEIGSMEVKKHELMHALAGERDQLTLLQNELKKSTVQLILIFKMVL